MSSSNFLSIVSILSASELTLGSYLHFLHIPLTGQLMSLNQCFWLNVSKIWSPEDSALKISLQVAAVKIMTPIGKRLTPMLAIAMQGLLFETEYFLRQSLFYFFWMTTVFYLLNYLQGGLMRFFGQIARFEN